MASELSDADYKQILILYDKSIPKSRKLTKIKAEKILANKLCSCIKKINDKKNEARAIAICTKTIINKKGLSRGRFTCKKNKKIRLTRIKH